MNQQHLTQIPSDSYCAQWVKDHNIKTAFNSSADYCQWRAWDERYPPEYMNDYYGCGFGQTELEAVMNWCVSIGMVETWYTPFESFQIVE